MNEKIRAILRGLRAELCHLYGERLKGIYMFGSYARGEAQDDSDLDVLIVLDRVDDYSREIDCTGDIVSGLSLRCGVTISRVFASEQRWQTDQTNFFLNVREEAVPA